MYLPTIKTLMTKGSKVSTYKEDDNCSKQTLKELPLKVYSSLGSVIMFYWLKFC